MMPDDQQPQRLTLTVDEAAARLGVSRNHAYESVKSGQIPSIKIGKRILVPIVAFERMLAGEGGKAAL